MLPDENKKKCADRMAEEVHIQELSHSESMGASLASADFNLLKHSVPPIYNEGNKAVVDAQ